MGHVPDVRSFVHIEAILLDEFLKCLYAYGQSLQFLHIFLLFDAFRAYSFAKLRFYSEMDKERVENLFRLVPQYGSVGRQACGLYAEAGGAGIVVERHLCLPLGIQFQVGVPIERAAVVGMLG